MDRISIPIFDPLGILEKATKDAPVTLYDPVSAAIRDALRGEHSGSEITPKEWEFAEFMWQSTKELMEKGDISGTIIWGILDHHYPGNKEKQTRLLGFMNDFLTEQKKRGPRGVPSDVLWELARKWDVERAIATEALRAFPGAQGG